MKTAEEILNTKREHGEYNNHYHIHCVLEAMEEYADQWRITHKEKECESSVNGKHEWCVSAAGFEICYYCKKYL